MNLGGQFIPDKVSEYIRSDSFAGLVWFYGISTIVSYLMVNPFRTYILDIYDLVGLGFIAYQLLLVI